VLPNEIAAKPRYLDAETKEAFEKVIGFLNSAGEVRPPSSPRRAPLIAST